MANQSLLGLMPLHILTLGRLIPRCAWSLEGFEIFGFEGGFPRPKVRWVMFGTDVGCYTQRGSEGCARDNYGCC
jgi:hypothetical protein